jgi:hypothetical protein
VILAFNDEYNTFFATAHDMVDFIKYFLFKIWYKSVLKIINKTSEIFI